MSKCKQCFICVYRFGCLFLGVLYLDDCFLEKYIFIYFVVFGSVGLFYNVFGIIKIICCKKNIEEGVGE